jgi:hypothetical protein
MHKLYKYCVGTLIVFAIAVGPALAQEPGTIPEDKQNQAMPAPKSLDDVFASESGEISTSIDGVGSNNPSGATVQVEKPSAGATVRRAFLIAAASPSDQLSESDITLSNGGDSETITSSDYENIVVGPNNEENGRVEITSFVSSVVDPLGAGMIDFTVVESTPSQMEGVVLVVIFDDPSVSEPRSTALIFGAQDQSGDSFSLGLADPFDDATQDIQMSLGISFGFQGFNQVSLVDVNGSRLTSAAGGQDDCDIFSPSNSCSQNGSLLTVGGIGDDPANPPDPFSNPGGDARYDDELYTLDDFVDDGDTQIAVDTENPSFDDNVFFAAFIVKGGTAVVGEGITLSPSTASNPVNTDHTVTATVQDDDGNPVQGRDVNFDITDGPNSGMTGSDVTDASGKASFTWSSSVVGNDIVVATSEDSEGNPIESNEAEKSWTPADTQCDVPTLGEDQIDQDDRTLSNTIQDDEGIDEFTFTTLENFTVSSVDPLEGIFTRSGNTWTFTGPGNPPTEVDFTLEAGPDNTSTYFLEVTDACEDPGPNTVTFDPSYEMGPGVEKAQLAGNSPNPFSGKTSVEFILAEQTRVTVSVYDMMGRKVATLVDGVRSSGTHTVGWNGQSDNGQNLASGVYLLRMQANGQSSTQRLTIVR